MTEHDSPRVAIVMRTKNRPILLGRALRSVAAQTFTDYRLVVVNDAGGPGPVDDAVATSPAGLRERTHVVHNDRSSGREGAMNDGIRASQSELVVIHDDDDTWETSFLSQTVRYLDEHPEHDGVAARTAIVYERIVGGEVVIDRTEPFIGDRTEISLTEVVSHNLTPPISLLYRRRVHHAVGDYDGSLPVLADWEFVLRMLSRGSIGFLDGEPLALWHHRTAEGGDLGNSIFDSSADHAAYDWIIRDRIWRAELPERGGLGEMLVVAKLLNQETNRLQHDIAGIREISLHTDDKAQRLTEAFDSRMHEQNARLGEQNERLAALTDAVRGLTHDLALQVNRHVSQLDRLHERMSELEELVLSQTPRVRLRSYGRLARSVGRRVLKR